jgi:hypothetical protein
MRPISFSTDIIQEFLDQHLVTGIDQLKTALGTSATSTVLRKLRSLGYLSSYSHRGSFYTLSSIPKFDELGLWHHDQIGFSKYGNLINTCSALVKSAQCGVSVKELNQLLRVETKSPLRHLESKGEIIRAKHDGVFVYYSNNPSQSLSQQKNRSDSVVSEQMGAGIDSDLKIDELKAAIILFYSLLNEKQRRLFAGLESLKRGYGGDQFIAQLLGLDPHTVARGRRELLDGDIDSGGIRKDGGGRMPFEKKRQKS